MDRETDVVSLELSIHPTTSSKPMYVSLLEVCKQDQFHIPPAPHGGLEYDACR